MVIIVALSPLSRKKPVTCHAWVCAGLPGKGEVGRIPFPGAQNKDENEAKSSQIPLARKRREQRYRVEIKHVKDLSLQNTYI
jgi:hypothetical protein